MPFLKKRRFPFTRPRHSGIRLQMVPMIDVVFLLLIYFLLTANFRTSEGFLPAQLPQQTQAAARSMVFDPLTLYLDSALDDSCLVQIDSPHCENNSKPSSSPRAEPHRTRSNSSQPVIPNGITSSRPMAAFGKSAQKT